ncbi:MAG: hypothetical protein E7Z97_07210 [Propionibacteriaceae bacterium]|nr:hypothetical protein [Propionibacteriaceae bacterium]
MREELLLRLGEQTERIIAALWAQVEAGALDEDLFAGLAATVIAAANGQGTAAGQAAFRAWQETATGTPATTSATLPADDLDRLTQAVGTILKDSTSTGMRLARLARSEPINAAQDAFAASMAGSAVVSGWRRHLDSDPCQLCQWWWREGRVWRPDHPMPRHPGCTCTQEPVLRERTDNYQTERQAVSAARTNQRRHRHGR